MLIEMLNVLEPLDLGTPNSYESIHLLAETMRRAYADRASYLGDADFASVPVAGLTSPRYAAQLRDEILARASGGPDPGRASRSFLNPAPPPTFPLSMRRATRWRIPIL